MANPICHALGEQEVIAWRAAEIESMTQARKQRVQMGWMRGLEVRARPVLQPMIQGHEKTPDCLEQLLLSTWGVKTATVSEPSIPAAAGRFTSEERRCTVVRPTGGKQCRVLCGSRGSRPAGYKPGAHGWRLHREGGECDLHFHTLQIGMFVLRVVR